MICETSRLNAKPSRERTVNPYALLPEAGSWYLVGRDLDAKLALPEAVAAYKSTIAELERQQLREPVRPHADLPGDRCLRQLGHLHPDDHRQ